MSKLKNTRLVEMHVIFTEDKIYDKNVIDSMSLNSKESGTFLIPAATSEEDALHSWDMVMCDEMPGTKMQIVGFNTDVQNTSTKKEITINWINGKKVSYNKNKNSNIMSTKKDFFKEFGNAHMKQFTEMYMPERQNGFFVSYDGHICVENKNGECIFIDANNKLMSWDKSFTLPFPAFSLRKPITELRKGDIIVDGKRYVYVESVNLKEGKIKGISLSSSNAPSVTLRVPTNMLMNTQTIPTILNYFAGLEGQMQNQGQFAMVMSMLNSMADDESENDDNPMVNLMMMQAMMPQQNGNNGIFSNPMFMSAFALGGIDGIKNMMPFMYMSNMMGNMGNNTTPMNPFGMFGMNQTPAPQPSPTQEQTTMPQPKEIIVDTVNNDEDGDASEEENENE